MFPARAVGRLRLISGDDAEFELNGQPLATDLFPRFENPFVRSGVPGRRLTPDA